MTATPAVSTVPPKYVEALDGRKPIETLRKGPKRLKKLLKGHGEKALAHKPAPGKWSAKEVVAHLADGEVVLGARLRFVAAMETPPLPGYDQDQFVARLGIERVKTKDLFEAFASMRALNVGLLERLPKDAFTRVGLHAERGLESIQSMVTMYAGHDVLHERQIERVLDAKEDKPAKAAKAKQSAKQVRKAEKEAAKRAEKLARRARKQAKAAKKAASRNGHAHEAPKPTRKPEVRETPVLLTTR